MVGWGEASRNANDPQYAEQDIPLDRIVRAAMHGATVETRGDHTMTQEDTALQAAWEEWLAAHPDRSTAGPVYRPGFEAGWAASRQVIDSLTAEREEAQRVAGNLLARIFRDGGHRAATYETLGEADAVADLEVANLFARAEAAEAEVKRLREAVTLHHEASVLARTVGVETHQAWGMRCPVCSAALAIPPSEGGQS